MEDDLKTNKQKFTQLERQPQQTIEDELKKKMEDNLKIKIKNERQPQTK